MLKIIIGVFLAIGFLALLVLGDYHFSGKKGVIKDNKHSYISTILIAVVYLSGGIWIILNYNFYPEIKNIILEPRFLWCAASSLLGLSLAASQKRFDKKLLCLQFLLFYPFVASLISALIYSLLSLKKEPLGNHIFYPLAFALCGTLSFAIDNYWSWFKEKFNIST